MDQLKKNLCVKNLLYISRYIPYLNKLISYSCFENKRIFDFKNEEDLNILFDYISKLEGKYEVKKIDEKFYVPIQKLKNKRIHSIYNPIKEAINVEQDKDIGICYEIFGIGFLYTLYGVDTVHDKGEQKKSKNSKISFILIDENLDLFLLSCCYLNTFEIFENNNIHIYIKGCKDIDYLKSEIYSYFANLYNPLFIDKIIRKENPNCFVNGNINESIEEWENFRKEIIFNIKTFTINFALELKNIFKNLETILQNTKLKDKILYQNEFFQINTKGKKEAIIIGASPTLDNEIIKGEILKQVKEGNKFVIAVDNAINFCMINDLQIDLLIILDNRNIVNLMLDRYLNKVEKVQTLFPLTCSSKFLNKFENSFIFNYHYFSDIPVFISQILKKSENLEFQILNLNKIDTKNSLNFDQILNSINILFSKIPILQIPVKNVGAFSYLIAKYLGFKDIKTYGIDFSFEKKKYYYKDAYFFDFYNIRQNYLNTTLGLTTKVCIKKGEKYLFQQYLQEWNEIKNKDLNVNYREYCKGNSRNNIRNYSKNNNKNNYEESYRQVYKEDYEDNCIEKDDKIDDENPKDVTNCLEKYFSNILSYLYIAGTKKEDLQKNLHLFLKNIFKLIIY